MLLNSPRFHLVVLSCLLALPVLARGEPPPTMRVDYFHTGKVSQELFALDRVVQEPLPWPGNPDRPLDDLNLGTYFFEVVDPATKKVLYSRGYSSIYAEWVTTEEARKATRTFHESLRFPTPDGTVEMVVKKRDANNAWKEVWTLQVDPRSKLVDRGTPRPPGPVIEIEKNGDPAAKVDILLLGDGYTEGERGKFEADARRLIEKLFAVSPFKERRKDFNVWGLCPAAWEAGISRPSAGVHRASPIGTTYDVFGSERYVLTFDNLAFRRATSFAPYEFVEILVNGRTYGGGGILGQYGTVAVDNVWAPYVFIHEFGHHFAGLADEYYASPVAYLPAAKRVEPWEPNVTALLDPANLKWKDLATPGVAIPTPWRKEEYEARTREFQARRAALRKENKPEAEMEALFAEQRRFDEHALAGEGVAGVVGAFEGANYEAKGFYRPQANCIMFTRADFFCVVCQRAITRVIDQYAGGSR